MKSQKRQNKMVNLSIGERLKSKHLIFLKSVEPEFCFFVCKLISYFFCLFYSRVVWKLEEPLFNFLSWSDCIEEVSNIVLFKMKQIVAMGLGFIEWHHLISWAQQSLVVNKQDQRSMKRTTKMFSGFGLTKVKYSTHF